MSGVIEIVAVTDSPLSPLVELADAWCEIEVPAVGPFDSSVPAVAIARIAGRKAPPKNFTQEATARIDRIEALWEKTEACSRSFTFRAQITWELQTRD